MSHHWHVAGGAGSGGRMACEGRPSGSIFMMLQLVKAVSKPIEHTRTLARSTHSPFPCFKMILPQFSRGHKMSNLLTDTPNFSE